MSELAAWWCIDSELVEFTDSIPIQQRYRQYAAKWLEYEPWLQHSDDMGGQYRPLYNKARNLNAIK